MDFEFDVQLNKKDYLLYFLFTFITDIKGIIWYFVLSLIPIIVFSVLFYVLFDFTKLYTIIIIATILTIICGFLFKFLFWNNIANNYIKAKFNTCKYIFEEDSFTTENRLKKYDYKATAILKVVDTKNYLFLYQTKEVAWILPKKQINESIHNSIINFTNNNNIQILKYNWC